MKIALVIRRITDDPIPARAEAGSLGLALPRLDLLPWLGHGSRPYRLQQMATIRAPETL